MDIYQDGTGRTVSNMLMICVSGCCCGQGRALYLEWQGLWWIEMRMMRVWHLGGKEIYVCFDTLLSPWTGQCLRIY